MNFKKKWLGWLAATLFISTQAQAAPLFSPLKALPSSTSSRP